MFLSIQLFLCSPEIINATSTSRLIDNDPIVSGYSGSYHNMTYNSGLSGSYNGDMRISSTGTDSFYRWRYPVIEVNSIHCVVTLYVYLNDVNFTDPYSRYDMMTYPIEDEGAGYYDTLGYINQNTAPAGWSHINSAINAYSGQSSIFSSAIDVLHSNNSGYLLLKFMRIIDGIWRTKNENTDDSNYDDSSCWSLLGILDNKQC